MLKRSIIGLIILVSQLLGFSLTIDKPTYYIATKSGSQTECAVYINNENSFPVELEVYLKDWKYAKENRGKIFLDKGITEASLAGWIELSKDKFIIPAKTETKYLFKVNTPKDAEGGHQAVMFFQANLPQKEKASFNYAVRLGSVLLQETIGKSEYKFEVVDSSVKQIKNKLNVAVILKNTGNVWNEVKGTVSLVAEDNVLEQKKLVLVKTLPGDKIKLETNLAETKKGETVLISLEDFKGNLMPLSVDLGSGKKRSEKEVVREKVDSIMTADKSPTEKQETVTGRPQLDLIKFNPVYSASSKELKLYVKLKTSEKVRVNALCKIFSVQSGKRVKTIYFEEKILTGKAEELLYSSWPAGEHLPAGGYSAVLNIKYGEEVISDKKSIVIK